MDILLDAHDKTDKERDTCGTPVCKTCPPCSVSSDWSVARHLVTVTAASDKRISGFSGGEDLIFDENRALIN